MKNIHVLPTDKQTKLHYHNGLFLSPNFQLSISINSVVQGRNIYITSDEEIKEGNYFYDLEMNEIRKSYGLMYGLILIESNSPLGCNPFFSKKIILTTDQDLIKDGVQAIDDEFLEWFVVENPSCEEVEVVKECCGQCDERLCEVKDLQQEETEHNTFYKIIIPQEKTRQIKCYCGHTITCDCEELKKETLTYSEVVKKEERIFNSNMLIKETLEEAARNYNTVILGNGRETIKQAFIKGAKWQAQRMYSEEDILDAWELGAKEGLPLTREKKEELFEQLKKKK
jgi:hypothetical protein